MPKVDFVQNKEKKLNTQYFFSCKTVFVQRPYFSEKFGIPPCRISAHGLEYVLY